MSKKITSDRELNALLLNTEALMEKKSKHLPPSPIAKRRPVGSKNAKKPTRNNTRFPSMDKETKHVQLQTDNPQGEEYNPQGDEAEAGNGIFYFCFSL